MVANYNKLWKILIDRNIRKEDLRVAAGITTTAMAKLGKNQPVHMEILLKICKVLDCQIEDVVEITEDVIDKAKKIKDANDDIRKIDDILNDSTSFHHKADTLYTCYKRIQSREKRAKEKRNIMNTRYLIVTDYFENDGIRDVADDIQRLIDENPNRVLFFPDGVYNLSKPILTPAAPKTSVCLQLSMYAVIRPHTDWNSDEALIRLGAKEPANDIHTIGSNYYLEGGISTAAVLRTAYLLTAAGKRPYETCLSNIPKSEYISNTAQTTVRLTPIFLA